MGIATVVRGRDQRFEMTSPTVSVLTISYNRGRWLADTLGSVACQTYPEVEHIVVDDGSTDNSIAVLVPWSCCGGSR